ncbi:hypothetical protein LZ554_002327 [Drepanopeziza brunnea f. sp. 'monogermtubi']|nr:hypothetical protein LZ554_002327 [Drepanopeziza brunnea f. sp. 'monogermtubi']
MCLHLLTRGYSFPYIFGISRRRGSRRLRPRARGAGWDHCLAPYVLSTSATTALKPPLRPRPCRWRRRRRIRPCIRERRGGLRGKTVGAGLSGTGSFAVQLAKNVSVSMVPNGTVFKGVYPSKPNWLVCLLNVVDWFYRSWCWWNGVPYEYLKVEGRTEDLVALAEAEAHCRENGEAM